MSEKITALELVASHPKDFGIFYPTGHLVVGFPGAEQARAVQANFSTGGYGREECAFFDGPSVVRATEANLDAHDGFFARLGWSDEAVRIHLKLARAGGAFLVLHARSDQEVLRAMNVIRRAPFVFVHRYHRLAIEELH